MTSTTPTDLVADRYEPLVLAARDRFFTSEAVTTITDPNTPADVLDRFLINYCALGVQMTEPVDGWIRGAGRACIEQGYAELGDALQRHADHEAGHHEMMIADTHSLVARWNGEHPDDPLDADALIDRAAPPGVVAYVDLHENVIASDEPFGQIAIEYEIERLSVTAGPMLIGNVAAVCGADRIAMLSFLTDHIALDEGHTVFNRRQMNAFLDEHPDAAETLGRTGAAALDAYAAFLADCLAES